MAETDPLLTIIAVGSNAIVSSETRATLKATPAGCCCSNPADWSKFAGQYAWATPNRSSSRVPKAGNLAEDRPSSESRAPWAS